MQGGNKRERFAAPSAQEVITYAKEINFDLDGQTFVDFYASKGWLIGKTPMKDWKAAVRTWKRRHEGEGQKRSSDPRQRILTPEEYEEDVRETRRLQGREEVA